jgi:hypothetical protein
MIVTRNGANETFAPPFPPATQASSASIALDALRAVRERLI